MILKESVEVAYVRVPKLLCNLPDSLLREKTKQKEGKLQPYLDLSVTHILSIPGDEVSLKPAQLNPNLGRDHACSKSRVAMLRLDEVVDELDRIVERSARRVVWRQSSALLDLGDDLAFDGPDMFDRTSGHAHFLKAESLQCPQGTPGAVSQRVRNLPVITLLSGPHRHPVVGDGDRTEIVSSRTEVKDHLSPERGVLSHLWRKTPAQDVANAPCARCNSIKPYFQTTQEGKMNQPTYMLLSTAVSQCRQSSQ